MDVLGFIKREKPWSLNGSEISYNFGEGMSD